MWVQIPSQVPYPRSPIGRGTALRTQTVRVRLPPGVPSWCSPTAGDSRFKPCTVRVRISPPGPTLGTLMRGRERARCPRYPVTVEIDGFKPRTSRHQWACSDNGSTSGLHPDSKGSIPFRSTIWGCHTKASMADSRSAHPGSSPGIPTILMRADDRSDHAGLISRFKRGATPLPATIQRERWAQEAPTKHPCRVQSPVSLPFDGGHS